MVVKRCVCVCTCARVRLYRFIDWFVNTVYVLVVGGKVVEPPELQHVSYFVDQPKVEVQQETFAESEQSESSRLESKSSLRKSVVKVESEIQQEIKLPEATKQETSK